MFESINDSTNNESEEVYAEDQEALQKLVENEKVPAITEAISALTPERFNELIRSFDAEGESIYSFGILNEEEVSTAQELLKEYANAIETDDLKQIESKLLEMIA